MTVIIKKLVIRGIVSNDVTHTGETMLKRDDFAQDIEEMKREITRDCVEKVYSLIKANARR